MALKRCVPVRRAAFATLLTLCAAGLGACRLTGAASSGPLPQSPTIRTPTAFLADQTPLSAVNALGPFENDRSNGGASPRDGGPLSLGGQVYARGLGVSAMSSLEYNVGAQCRSFTAQIGVDDTAAAGSAATFSVLADGRSMIPPIEMSRGSDPQTVTVDIEGVERLKLVVEPRESGRAVPADWADAKLQGCVTYAGPLEVGSSTTVPIVITGNYRSDDPKVPAIRINTTQPVVIRNCTLAGRGHLIANGRPGVNVRVENCRGYGLNPQTWMVSPGRFVSAEGPQRLTVENSFLKGTGGIYLLGNSTQTSAVKILRNRALNIDGRRSDGAGGWLTPAAGDRPLKFFAAQFVQFNAVNGVPDAEIAWNRVENLPGQSRVEDNINIYGSSGVSGSPIRIHHNLILGAYPYPTTLQQFSGGGIITDGCLSRHVEISDNTVLETGNHGISIAGGDAVTIRGNTIFNTGLLPDGGLSGGGDSGIYARWPARCSQRGIDFANNRIVGNTIAFTQVDRPGDGRREDLFIDTAQSGVPLAAVSGNILLPRPPCQSCAGPELIRTAVTEWEQQAAATGVAVGPSSN